MKIAFVGLGKMGLGPALMLIKAGYEVHTAVHHHSENVLRFRECGGIVDYSFAEAVADAEFVFTILPDDAALEDFALNEEVLKAFRKGAVLIDMTSCSAQMIQKVAAQLMPLQVEVLDAPVSGGVEASKKGTMAMICAGKESVFKKAYPLLEVIGEYIVLAGTKAGDGKKIKSLNNLLGAINKAAAGEMAQIVEKNHLDPQIFYDVICHSSGCSVGFEKSWPRLQNGEVPASFTIAQMRKDVNLAFDLTGDLNLPISKEAKAYYDRKDIDETADSSLIAKQEYR